MAGLSGGKEEGNGREFLRGGPAKSVFGRYSDEEMLSQLKQLALDPCNLGFSQEKIRPLWNQTLKVIKARALSDAEFPQRKRKLKQFLKDNLRSTSRFSSEELVRQNTELSGGKLSHSSSLACLVNSVGSFDQKIPTNSCSSSSLLTCEYDTEDFFLLGEQDRNPPYKKISTLVDSEESLNGSSPSPLENLGLPETSLPSLNGLTYNLSSPNMKGRKRRHLQPPRQSVRIMNFIGDHSQRMVVPVGPRFQADVPDWRGVSNGDAIYGENTESEESKWLGTRMWPIEKGSTKFSSRVVGKGRPDSCSCRSPGSINCVRRHIFEKRLLLQCDLGPAFIQWKFDEIGDQASKSWNSKEKQTLELVVKSKTMLNEKIFLKHAQKCFPNKCRKTVMAYYFNVILPQRMSLQTRLTVKQVESDEDVDAEDLDHMRQQQNCRAKSSNNMKTIFLSPFWMKPDISR